MHTRPNVLSNQILHLHTNIARGEAFGGTYGVCGEKRIWRRVGYLLLVVNERDILGEGRGLDVVDVYWSTSERGSWFNGEQVWRKRA